MSDKRENMTIMLISMGFAKNYINRAFRLYDKNNKNASSSDINQEVIIDIIFTLQNKDQNNVQKNLAVKKKKKKKSLHKLPSGVVNKSDYLLKRKNMSNMLISMGFDQKYIDKALDVHEKTSLGANYKIEVITEIIVRLQDKAKKNQKKTSIKNNSNYNPLLDDMSPAKIQLQSSKSSGNSRSSLNSFLPSPKKPKNGTNNSFNSIPISNPNPNPNPLNNDNKSEFDLNLKLSEFTNVLSRWNISSPLNVNDLKNVFQSLLNKIYKKAENEWDSLYNGQYKNELSTFWEEIFETNMNYHCKKWVDSLKIIKNIKIEIALNAFNKTICKDIQNNLKLIRNIHDNDNNNDNIDDNDDENDDNADDNNSSKIGNTIGKMDKISDFNENKIDKHHDIDDDINDNDDNVDDIDDIDDDVDDDIDDNDDDNMDKMDNKTDNVQVRNDQNVRNVRNSANNVNINVQNNMQHNNNIVPQSAPQMPHGWTQMRDQYGYYYMNHYTKQVSRVHPNQLAQLQQAFPPPSSPSSASPKNKQSKHQQHRSIAELQQQFPPPPPPSGSGSGSGSNPPMSPHSSHSSNSSYPVIMNQQQNPQQIQQYQRYMQQMQQQQYMNKYVAMKQQQQQQQYQQQKQWNKYHVSQQQQQYNNNNNNNDNDNDSDYNDDDNASSSSGCATSSDNSESESMSDDNLAATHHNQFKVEPMFD